MAEHNMINVTVITPTTGSSYLEQAIDSVEKQTYKNVKHLVVADGVEYQTKVNNITEKFSCSILNLPFNTGAGGYNGHRIYGASVFLVDTDYFCFLDEDNYLDKDHVESLVDSIGNSVWGYSLRKIVDETGSYICNDDCESLGTWASCLNEKDFFVDLGCFFLPKMLAIKLAPGYYRRARHPNEQPEIDRLMSMALINQYPASCSGKYTLNYRAGNRVDSVQKEFFIRGNEYMKTKYKGEYPWRKI